MDHEPGEEVIFRGHPSWLSLAPMLVRGIVLSLVVGIGAGLASAIADGRVQTGWVVIGVLAIAAIVLTRGQTRRLRVTYAVTSRRLAIETGLMSRRLHQTALEQVEHVRARQTLLERALGVGTVHFDTGALQQHVSFRGVEHPRRIAATVERFLQDHGLGPYDWD